MSYAAAANRIIDNPEAYDAKVHKLIAERKAAKFHRENPDANELLNFIEKNSGWSDFYKSLQKCYEDFGGLSVNQCNSVRTAMAKAAAKRAVTIADAANNSQHLGEVGKRENFTFTIKTIIAIPGIYGTSYLHLCENENQCAIVYKGTSEIGGKGDKVTVKATVKEHSVYNGIKQTVLSRPKLV